MRPAGSRWRRESTPLLLFSALLAAAWLTSPAEGSLPRTGFQDANPAALAGAGAVDSGRFLTAGLETPFSLITVEELEKALACNPAPEAGGLNLVEGSLLEPPELTSRACEASFSLYLEPVDFGLNPQRGPPLEIPDLHQGWFVADPKTRIGGFGLELEDLTRGECSLSLGLRRGYEVEGWGLAEEERPDPLGLLDPAKLADRIDEYLVETARLNRDTSSIPLMVDRVVLSPVTALLRFGESEGKLGYRYHEALTNPRTQLPPGSTLNDEVNEINEEFFGTAGDALLVAPLLRPGKAAGLEAWNVVKNYRIQLAVDPEYLSGRAMTLNAGPAGVKVKVVKTPKATKVKATNPNAYDRTKIVKGPFSKNRLEAIKADPSCQYCQNNPSTDADHVVSSYDADALVGAGIITEDEAVALVNDVDNLLGVCKSCNSSKGNRVPGNVPGTWKPKNPTKKAITKIKKLGTWEE